MLLCQYYLRRRVYPFHATDLFRYPLKTSESQRLSDVFGGGRGRGGVSKEISGMKWVNAILFIVHGPDLSVLAINPGVFEKEML